MFPSPSIPFPLNVPLYSGISTTGGSMMFPSPSIPFPLNVPLYSGTLTTGGVIGLPFSSIPCPLKVPCPSGTSTLISSPTLYNNLSVTFSVSLPVFGSTVYSVRIS